MTDQSEPKPFEGWVILELMGHRRLAGRLTEQVIGGGAFLRLDVPGELPGSTVATQFYAPSAVYCITPTTETIARALAQANQPAPATAWELRPERTLPASRTSGDVDDDELRAFEE